MTGQRGIALIMVMLVTTFLSALGLGLMLAVFMDRLATGNMAGSVAMLYAADAGIELAARDLAQAADWDAVLSGAERSSFTDGAAGGVRAFPAAASSISTAVDQHVELRQGHQLHRRADECELKGAAVGREQSALAAVRVRADGAASRSCAARCRATSRCGLPTMAGRRTAIRWPTPSTRTDPGHGIVRVHAEVFGRGWRETRH